MFLSEVPIDRIRLGRMGLPRVFWVRGSLSTLPRQDSGDQLGQLTISVSCVEAEFLPACRQHLQRVAAARHGTQLKRGDRGWVLRMRERLEANAHRELLHRVAGIVADLFALYRTSKAARWAAPRSRIARRSRRPSR